MNLLERYRESRGCGVSNATSAEIIVPMLVRMFNPTTVLDVGCGSGAWSKVYANYGCSVMGIDKMPCKFTHKFFTFRQSNLIDNLLSFPIVDLTLCLEVAEHLPEDCAESLVARLVNSAPVIIFAAGIPCQGGWGHVNEQWLTWWAELFYVHKYYLCDYIRSQIWKDKRISPWYRQDIVVFCNFTILKTLPIYSPPVDLVHPDCWTHIGLMGIWQRIMNFHLKS